MAAFTKALPANNQVQLQYFWTQSEVTGYSGPMFYDFEMDPASPYFPTASPADMRQRPGELQRPAESDRY